MDHLFFPGGSARANGSRFGIFRVSPLFARLTAGSRSISKAARYFYASSMVAVVLCVPALSQAAWLGFEAEVTRIAEGTTIDWFNVALYREHEEDVPTVESESCTVTGTLQVVGGTATEGEDFVLSTHTFTFTVRTSGRQPEASSFIVPSEVGEWENHYPLAITALADDLVEGDEDFALEITDVQDDCRFSGGVRLHHPEGGAQFLNITILDTTEIPEEDEVPEEEEEVVESRDLASRAYLTARQREVAAVLDTACRAIDAERSSEGASLVPQAASADQQLKLLQTCDALASSSTLGQDLDALAFRSVTSLGTMTWQSAELKARSLSRQIQRRRQGGGGLDLSGLQLRQGDQVVSGDILTRGAGAGDSFSFGRWGAFLSGSLELGEYDQTTSTDGYDFDINALLAGLDYRFDDRWVIGAALNYTDSSADIDLRHAYTDMKGGGLALFASYSHDDRLYFDVLLGAGRSDYDTRRAFTVAGVPQGARGDTDGSDYNASLNGGYLFHWRSHYVRLFGNVNYVRVDIDGFSEVAADGSSSGMMLHVGDQRVESTTVGIGTELGWNINTTVGVFSPQLTFDCEHRFGDGVRTSGSRFLGDPTETAFSTDTESPDRNYCHAGAGLSAVLPGGISPYLWYRTSLQRDDFSSHALSLGVRAEF